VRKKYLNAAPTNQLLNVAPMAAQEAPHCCSNDCPRFFTATPKTNSTTLHKLLTNVMR